MQITIESPHIDISIRLRRQIKRKLEALNKIYERIITCDIILRQQSSYNQNRFNIEAKLSVPKGSLFAKERAENFSIALARLSDNIKRQLIKHKEKMEEIR
ncbi:MAG TPA: ribosome-associated translation inhibitor RaiA [Parafilimonas sp.]|nr:ribosome-associated translation inhibitor RaiA [Parafilimonas sp.]